MYLSWTNWQFVLAGFACATGPILIHLLNRRRTRTVSWAAMHLLREALIQQQRRLRLRDWFLLLLRTAAILLFASGLARPFFSPSSQGDDNHSPIHAVIIVDNSLSMGYLAADGSLLDQAKTRCLSFIRKLPTGSAVNLIPACGNEIPLRPDPYTRLDEIRSALGEIQIVDQSVHLRDTINRAQQACQIANQLSKRIVFFTDQQQIHWTDTENLFDDVASLQIVDVAPSSWENTWVSGLRIQDGLADTSTPTTIHVRLEHHGLETRRNIPVTLSVDGKEVATKTVTLRGDQDLRELTFEYTFSDFTPSPGVPLYVPIAITLPPDRLNADNERFLAVPVVKDLPIVFVDQYSNAEEDAAKSQIGETYQLRRLLAPNIPRDANEPPVFKIRHLSIRELHQQQREAISDARLVIIAGVADPEGSVDLLREYLTQGGRLIVGTGGQFDHVLWNRAAWRAGDGILPGELTGTVGQLPELTSNPRLFTLAFESMEKHHYFRLPGVSKVELEALFSEPVFFKAVGIDAGASVRQSLYRRELARLTRHVSRTNTEAKENNEGSDDSIPDNQPLQWLNWQTAFAGDIWGELPEELNARQRFLESRAARELPQIRARYTNSTRSPFLVERQIGQGNTLFISTGFLARWNTLAQTHAFLIFDRIVRSQVHATLPIRDFASGPRIAVDIAVRSRTPNTRIFRPNRFIADSVDAGLFHGPYLSVEVLRPLTRGMYRIATQDDTTNQDITTCVSVNGPAEESNLTALSRAAFNDNATATQVRWIGQDEAPTLAGVAIQGQTIWRWLIGGVILILLAETILLIRQHRLNSTTSPKPQL
ncbi:MAG: hypothetical protein CMJ75_22725 [Planctomycetaceae bacterium]|nr:hypothetical protein [Planctomycetaceae bacterium]